MDILDQIILRSDPRSVILATQAKHKLLSIDVKLALIGKMSWKGNNGIWNINRSQVANK